MPVDGYYQPSGLQNSHVWEVAVYVIRAMRKLPLTKQGSGPHTSVRTHVCLPVCLLAQGLPALQRPQRPKKQIYAINSTGIVVRLLKRVREAHKQL